MCFKCVLLSFEKTPNKSISSDFPLKVSKKNRGFHRDFPNFPIRIFHPPRPIIALETVRAKPPPTVVASGLVSMFVVVSVGAFT